MTEPDKQATNDSVPRRFRRYPYGPLRLRLAAPIVAAVVGLAYVIRGISLAGASENGESYSGWTLAPGLGLIVLAAIALVVARWMAKRGI